MQVPEVKPATNLYETDFYAWIQEQGNLLRDRQWNQIDLPNLIDEVESVGKQQPQELRNNLSILLDHFEYTAGSFIKVGTSTLGAEPQLACRHSGSAPKCSTASPRKPQP